MLSLRFMVFLPPVLAITRRDLPIAGGPLDAAGGGVTEPRRGGVIEPRRGGDLDLDPILPI
jgi:hypothetical protein